MAVVSFPGPRESIPHATAFRSTWIVSSIETMRTSPHWDRYVASLREHRDEILSVVAGAWTPIHVAAAHYRACDALGLASEEIAALGQGPGGRVRRSWFSPSIAAAEIAESPWQVLGQLHRMWRRGANGGACGVFRVQEQQARIELVGCELFDIRYFSEAVRAVYLLLLKRSCDQPRVQLLPQPASSEACYLVHWRGPRGGPSGRPRA